MTYDELKTNIANFLKYCVGLDRNFDIYNYADKPDLSARELVDVIYESFGKEKPKFYIPYYVGLLAGYGFDVLAKMIGRTLPISSIRVKKFCSDTVVTSDKSMQSGYVPQYSLSDGVRRMIDHDFSEVKK